MPKHLLWWGGVFLSLGGVVFCMGTTARLAGQFNNVHYTGVQSGEHKTGTSCDWLDGKFL